MNLLARRFAAAAPNQRWVGDTTEFVIGSSGKLYLAAILDLYSLQETMQMPAQYKSFTSKLAQTSTTSSVGMTDWIATGLARTRLNE